MRPAAAAVLLALLLPPLASAADRALDPRQFAEALDELTSAISSADAAHIGDLSRRVPTGWSISIGADRVEVPAGWVQEQLALGVSDPTAWPAVRERVLGRLRSIRGEARALAATTPPATAEDARLALGEILNRPEFVERRSSTWLQDLKARVTEWILRLWERMGGQRLGRRGTAFLLAWIAGVGALAVLAWWLVGAIVRSSPRTPWRLAPEMSHRLSARAWALRAASATDLREAARCAYNAAVTRLNEEGAWKLDDARTPREYLRLLPPAHRRRPVLADMTASFEQIWYGGRLATATDRDRLLDGLKELGCLPRA